MGVVQAAWAGAAPDPARAATALAEATGLAVSAEPDGLYLPRLGERVFEWEANATGLRCAGFAPAHPYLWENLDAVIAALGGARVAGPTLWSSTHPGLRRPWSALPRQTQWLLRLPSIAGARPLDRFL